MLQRTHQFVKRVYAALLLYVSYLLVDSLIVGLFCNITNDTQSHRQVFRLYSCLGRLPH